MEEKQLNERESLQLIKQMITMAKKEQRDDGRGWIIWGWLLFLASLLTVANLHFQWFQTFFFWNAFGLATILIFAYEAIAGKFYKRTAAVKTYTGDLFTRLNAGFFICLIFILVALNVGTRVIAKKYGVMDMTFINIGYALLINLYAFWILIYGTALNFRPSIIGAYCTWAFGAVALFVQDFEQVMLLHAGAVLAGYIIPGHLANKEFKRLKRKDKVTERV
ncbi:MAG TPA: hypothetical protein VGN63_04840 [Flavisolibacter sp.]|jgi:hypothetical protein|nr:hypothetical protein [Flavisolibacter sp.]